MPSCHKVADGKAHVPIHPRAEHRCVLHLAEIPHRDPVATLERALQARHQLIPEGAAVEAGGGAGVAESQHRVAVGVLAQHQDFAVLEPVAADGQLIQITARLAAVIADLPPGELRGAALVVDRLPAAWLQTLAQAVEGPWIKGGVAVDDRRLQRQVHRAHLLLVLAGTGSGAVEVHDRAVHIEIATEQVRELGVVLDRAQAAAVTLIHRPETDAGAAFRGGARLRG
jgi:hypothetical protein